MQHRTIRTFGKDGLQQRTAKTRSNLIFMSLLQRRAICRPVVPWAFGFTPQQCGKRDGRLFQIKLVKRRNTTQRSPDPQSSPHIALRIELTSSSSHSCLQKWIQIEFAHVCGFGQFQQSAWVFWHQCFTMTAWQVPWKIQSVCFAQQIRSISVVLYSVLDKAAFGPQGLQYSYKRSEAIAWAYTQWLFVCAGWLTVVIFKVCLAHHGPTSSSIQRWKSKKNYPLWNSW